MSTPRLYVLKSAPPPWGDFGSILWHGMTENRTSDGRIKLQRTGPFVPPVSLPWPTIVVTDAVRSHLEPRELTGFTFADVVRHRIVELDWRAWPADAAEPPKLPSGGEPENYIVRRPHAPVVASNMVKLWELQVREVPGLQLEGGAVDYTKYTGQDIVRGGEYGHTYVSPRFRDAMLEVAADWLTFEEASG